MANLQSLFYRDSFGMCGSLGRSLGHFLKKWDSNYNNSWEKLQIYGWNIPYIYHFMNLKWFLITTQFYHIQSFHTLVQTNVITHWLYLLSIAGESECVSVQILEREGSFLGPVGSLRVLLPIWPGQIPLLYPDDDISKNHLPRPCSFRGDRCLSFPVFFRLVF